VIFSAAVITDISVMIVRFFTVYSADKSFAVLASNQTFWTYNLTTVFALIEGILDLTTYVADTGLG
jgi:hypothetical protein